MTTTPPALLLSHTPSDQSIHDQLRLQLEPLAHRGAVVIRSSGDMRSRSLGSFVAHLCLSTARIYVPLLSPEFVACPAKYAELERAAQFARSGNLLILPLLVRDIDLDATPLAGYRPVSYGGLGLAHADHLDLRLASIASSIRLALDPRPRDPRLTQPEAFARAPQRILAAFASPPHGLPLNVGYEGKTIAKALSSAPQIKLKCLAAASGRDIHHAISSASYDTVHLSCHFERGQLALTNQTGHLATVDARALADMLVRHGVRTLLLNACNSATLSGELPGFERVVLMRGMIMDDDAIAFSHYFYESLACGSSFALACADGQSGIRFTHNSARPVLLKGGREVPLNTRRTPPHSSAPRHGSGSQCSRLTNVAWRATSGSGPTGETAQDSYS